MKWNTKWNMERNVWNSADSTGEKWCTVVLSSVESEKWFSTVKIYQHYVLSDIVLRQQWCRFKEIKLRTPDAVLGVPGGICHSVQLRTAEADVRCWRRVPPHGEAPSCQQPFDQGLGKKLWRLIWDHDGIFFGICVGIVCVWKLKGIPIRNPENGDLFVTKLMSNQCTTGYKKC